MRYGIITVLLATWLTFTVTNASPLPAKKGTETDYIQKLLSELTGTIETENKNEGVSKTNEISNPDEANEEMMKAQKFNALISTHHVAFAQSCGWSEWYECGSVVIDCATSCYNLEASSCITCAGDSYYTCKDCFSRLEDLKRQKEMMKSQNALISPHNVVNAQSCGWSEWYECGSVVIDCATSCYNLEASSCITCAGDSYYTCKDCFSRLEEAKSRLMVN